MSRSTVAFALAEGAAIRTIVAGPSAASAWLSGATIVVTPPGVVSTPVHARLSVSRVPVGGHADASVSFAAVDSPATAESPAGTVELRADLASRVGLQALQVAAGSRRRRSPGRRRRGRAGIGVGGPQGLGQPGVAPSRRVDDLDERRRRARVEIDDLLLLHGGFPAGEHHGSLLDVDGSRVERAGAARFDRDARRGKERLPVEERLAGCGERMRRRAHAPGRRPDRRLHPHEVVRAGRDGAASRPRHLHGHRVRVRRHVVVRDVRRPRQRSSPLSVVNDPVCGTSQSSL